MEHEQRSVSRHAVPSMLDLLRFTTAGSVDDGKSTLIGRLLHDAGALHDDQIESLRARAQAEGSQIDFSLVTDGLKAEREQRITIDVAYRYFATPKRRFIIADTPGHEQYTRNMATGASTADLAVILVDARLGVQTQSRRHGFIVSLLAVQRVIVAVNKMDLVDYDEAVFERIRREYGEFAARLGFVDLTFIPLSALNGDNVVAGSARMPWYTSGSLLAHLESAYIGGDTNLIDFRFPVQRAVRPNAEFRGYSGQIASGIVRPGDAVVVMPSGKVTRVTRIVTFDRDVEYAYPPQSVTLCLADDVDVSRGDVIAHPNNTPRIERAIQAMIVWMDDAPLCTGRTFWLKHATSRVKATCTELGYRVNPDTLHREQASTLALNDIGRARFTLFRPLAFDAYQKNRTMGSFILIDPASNATVGAGMIIERRTMAEARTTADARSSPNVVMQSGKVEPEARARILGHQPITVWLTGLPGSGKSTIAHALERELIDAGRASFVLDGDNLRHGLNRNLGFTPEDRKENIRRVAETARLMNEAGLIAIVALISPYRDDRAAARGIIGPERFVEVHVAADLETCERRDPKGLYAKARRGEVPEFTGVSAPYEVPDAPAMVLDTVARGPEDCVAEVLVAVLERACRAPLSRGS